MKYIDADRLKEEFQKRFDICKKVSEDDRNALDTQDWYRGKYTAYSECLSFIDSLQQEQPEVDLEKEIELAMPQPYSFLEVGVFNAESVYSKEQMVATARHFYELGQRKAAEMYDEIEYNRQRAEEESK